MSYYTDMFHAAQLTAQTCLAARTQIHPSVLLRIILYYIIIYYYILHYINIFHAAQSTYDGALICPHHFVLCIIMLYYTMLLCSTM